VFGFESTFKTIARLSADRVFTESEFHAVDAATVKSRDATEVCTSGR